MSRRALIWSVTAILSLTTLAGLATAGADDKIDKLALDYAVPDSPAFAILDLTPENVVRPKSPRDLATSLLNGVDREGNFQTGLALDVNPFLLAVGKTLELDEYMANPDGLNASRLLARTQVSLATTKGASSDDESVRIALGALWTPYDEGDPRLDIDLRDCIDRSQKRGIDDIEMARRANRAIMQKLYSSLPPAERDRFDQLLLERPNGVFVQPDPRARWNELSSEEKANLPNEVVVAANAFFSAFADAKTTNEARVENCRKVARKRNENASAWTISGAPRWESTSGSVDDVKFRGGGVWSSIAFGRRPTEKEQEEATGFNWLIDASQIIATVRYRSDTPVPDPDNEGKFIDQDDILVGARWRVGVERIRFSLEGAYLHEKRDGSPNQDIGRFSLGAELKIAENWWLQVSGGGESGGSGDNQNQSFVLSSIKFALPSEPTIPIPGT